MKSKNKKYLSQKKVVQYNEDYIDIAKVRQRKSEPRETLFTVKMRFAKSKKI